MKKNETTTDREETPPPTSERQDKDALFKEY